MPVTKYYRCRKCKTKVSPTYLAQHWLRHSDHFAQMYEVVEFETQTVFQLNVEDGTLTEAEKRFLGTDQ